MEKDEDGRTEYDRAIANGWAELTDAFVTEHGTGRRLYLTADAATDYTTPKVIAVSSGFHEFYLRYLSREASMLRAARVDEWWASNWPRIERDLDALPVAGAAMAARRTALKAGMKFTDAVSKLSLRHLSLTSGMKKLNELGLNVRITRTGRREFFDSTTGAVRAAWDAGNKKGGNHWHKFAPDGKTPINDAGRVVGKQTGAAHIPSK